MARRLVVPLLAVAVAVALSANAARIDAAAAARSASFSVQGSVEQVAVTRAPSGATVRLLDTSGHAVGRRRVDEQGAALFRHVEPGPGYRAVIKGARSGAVTVASTDEVPPESTYTSQQLEPGFGYLTTRDGTRLSINISLPGPVDRGPYPTVVEYSGYDPSNPDDVQPASQIARLLGYATVGVNLRGTGCSGGAFDYFEPLQSLDGYDVIETVAAQPWVANGKVGMIGISYPGVAQLFVAATRPPHLAAITPLSVIDDTYQVLYPGGILNNGFAVGWARERQDAARPEADAWVRSRIEDGDKTCRRNQLLRLQSADLEQKIARLGRGKSAEVDALAPGNFVNRIDVPVFIAGAWQDEETGAHFAEMLDQFAPNVVVKATVVNGLHADTLGPALLTRWAEFLDFYVARRVPSTSQATRLVANAILSAGSGGVITLPPDRFDPAESYETALASYESEPRVRVLFDSGAGGPVGAPVPAFEATFPSWPPPTTEARTWYFEPGGRLGASAPPAASSDQYADDPTALPRTLAARDGGGGGGGGLYGSAQYDWKPLPEGDAVAYVSAPLDTDTVMLGSGSVDVWLRSTARDVDLEVTLSEVRPDGEETYVQSGWLRASRRALDEAGSTSLHPVPTYRAADAAPLPPDEYSLVRVPLFPFGHVFRAGSSIRVAVQPPGGNRPKWAFEARPESPATNGVALGGANASRVVLPVVSGVNVPTPRPECGSLRGQPCRDYVPTANARTANDDSASSEGPR
jgi:predicted acyl esterase